MIIKVIVYDLIYGMYGNKEDGHEDFDEAVGTKRMVGKAKTQGRMAGCLQNVRRDKE